MNNISHSHRIEEIDFLKCVFILLMIAFHLSYIEHLYPYAKNIVFTFHMPAFLFISGYLFNINKKWNVFLRSIKWDLYSLCHHGRWICHHGFFSAHTGPY
jgi:fucose 4-O-acetylase-like acetyltransferase